MQLRQAGMAAALLCLAVPAWAADKKPEPVLETKFNLRPAAAPVKASLSTATYEVYKNVTIAPGQSVSLDSSIDFSAADRVAVTYRSASNTDLSVLDIAAYWSVPIADSFSAAETDSGANFPYTNTGGQIFNVYGNQFRLVLGNAGKNTIVITQVTVYTRTL